jgi:hypothetical protein
MKIITTLMFFLLFYTVEAQTKFERITTCPQSAPTGWVKTGVAICENNCGRDAKECPVFTRIDNLPSKTELDICPGDTPEGWVVIGENICVSCGINATKCKRIKKL